MSESKHPSARRFNDLGLFGGIESFEDLERRITALDDERMRGAAFEVFAEACLATQRIFQAKTVWPQESIPPSVRERLRLPTSDMGVDGVYETPTQEAPVCYQVKFRSGRPTLSWTELSTFYGLAAPDSRKLVFTNSDTVSQVAEERLGAMFVRGSDLDALDAEDFQIIDSWLKKKPPKVCRKVPMPHQTEAIDDILHGFESCSRVTALMACGTGKTMVALWVAERLKSRSILVLVPSLALVRQTLREWMRETSWPSVQFLCVCSDASVQSGEDTLLVRPSDLSFPVTTEPEDVRAFLKDESKETRIVFCTYHSSTVVSKAQSGLEPFDLGVFDEAHKTAGRNGVRFAHALDDRNVSIERRLFLTATPRHYDVSRKDKYGESRVVYSMDVPDVYGPVVHRMPFNVAASREIITDYKVVISVVTSEMVNNELLRRGVVLVDGDEVKARQVANQIALKSAIESFAVRKVFTFHSRVSAAASFVGSASEGVATHLPDFNCAYIKGSMSTALRERKMREFSAARHAVLSNARCLTEGVDVPAVDMVAFLSPKRSLVDIVQATGRAMRRSPGKKCGYVLVPLYVEAARGESVEEAILRSKFDEVWRVLQGIKEQDDLLAQIIEEMGVEKGRTGGFDDSRFRERVETLGPAVSLEQLRDAISAATLETVGEQWHQRFGELLAYKEKNGDCDVPARYAPNPKLAKWVVDQRVRRKRGILDSDKIELLDQLGFSWSPRSKNWMVRYEELKEYQERFGHTRVPQNWVENPQLAKWVTSQRVRYGRGKLSEKRTRILEGLDFEWNVAGKTWEERFAELREFKEEFGHTRVPAKYPPNQALGQWVVSQRYDRRKNELDQKKERLLESIGFAWEGLGGGGSGSSDRNVARFREMVEQLKIYSQKHGTTLVKIVDAKTKTLSQWTGYQRGKKRRGKLNPEQEAALNEIDFIWEPRSRRSPKVVGDKQNAHDRKWDKMFALLTEHLRNESAANSAESLPNALRSWIQTQRQQRRQGRLRQDRSKRLDQIGFEWEPYNAGWDQMFKLLESYRTENGDCLVPANWPEDPRLASWVRTQRARKAKALLAKHREAKLNGLGFDWGPAPASTTVSSPTDETWRRMYLRLQQFYDSHGHSLVPLGYPADKNLGWWVRCQRRQRPQLKVHEDQVAQLDLLQFDWTSAPSPPSDQGSTQTITNIDAQPESWDLMLGELRAYKVEFGNCLVPQRWEADPELARWVSDQRTARKRGMLNELQVTLLTAEGFDWDPNETHWRAMFERLSSFISENGHMNLPKDEPEYQDLLVWIRNQRGAMRQKRPIMRERGPLLDEIGFVWKEREPNIWEKMFERLVEFRRVRGHCNVPQKYPADKKLGRWVNTQRIHYRRGNVPLDRIERLEAIGFVWNTKPKAAGDEETLL